MVCCEPRKGAKTRRPSGLQEESELRTVGRGQVGTAISRAHLGLKDRATVKSENGCPSTSIQARMVPGS